MAEGSIVKADPSKPTDLEFDISIQSIGIDKRKAPMVRFILHTSCAEGDMLFVCKNVSDTLWSVTIPALKQYASSTLAYSLEVVVDGYFFEPATGDVIFDNNAAVSATATTTVAKSVAKTAKKIREKETLKEASGGIEVTGQYAPTNALLKPEYQPPQSHAKAPGTEKDDENIDRSKLKGMADLGTPVPGTGTDDSDMEGAFDPTKVAIDIIKTRIGHLTKPYVKGRLFARDAEGKPMVEGFYTAEQKQQVKERSDKIKAILHST